MLQRISVVLGATLAFVLVVALAATTLWWFTAAPINAEAAEGHVSQWSAKARLATEDEKRPEAPKGVETFRPISFNGDQPFHWCPSDGVIGYTIDLDRAEKLGLDPDDEVQAWDETFAMWSGKGYTFEYRGEGDHPISTNGSNYGITKTSINSGTIAITYATTASHPDLHDAVGLGGIFHPTSNEAISKGSIVMDGRDLRSLSDSQAQRTRVHEAGHAIGLGHVQDAGQLMYGQLDNGVATPQKGDIEGLEYLTRQCY